ncbi:hypothetical protein DL93DRAFT_2069702 [Clavulina sp. PMI_390]|nr:hypothetical protein DL93DRAFT_2069702 [Clavulina sp. PMI_390]
MHLLASVAFLLCALRTGHAPAHLLQHRVGSCPQILLSISLSGEYRYHNLLGAFRHLTRLTVSPLLVLSQLSLPLRMTSYLPQGHLIQMHSTHPFVPTLV